MTLNMALLTEWGVWSCSDFRLTLRDGTLYPDRTHKLLSSICRDGTALISYTGLGMRRRNYPLSDWIRNVLRGHQYTTIETINAIQAYASRELASDLKRWQLRHAFQIVIVNGGPPEAVLLMNTAELDPHGGFLDYFESYGYPPSEKGEVVMTGAWQAVAEEDRDLLREAANREPRHEDDLHDLLRTVNRRAAEHSAHGHLISPGCITTFMPLSGQPTNSKIHGGGGESAPAGPVPMLLFGVDVTSIIADMGSDDAAGAAVKVSKRRVIRLATLPEKSVEKPNGR